MKTEAERQQALMAAILRRDDGASLHEWVAARPAGVTRGLQAYQANAGASAERALAAAYPTVQALVGEDSFAALSRAFWHAEPPARGDLAQFGAGLPAFIAASDQLADVPYLADVALLDWHLAESERALDAQIEAETLHQLTEVDPAQLHLLLMPGVAVLLSDYPIVSLWKAHRPVGDAAEHRTIARQRLDHGQGEEAVVWRLGWRAQADIVDAATARWMQSLLKGESLAAAFEHAGASFEFEPWLVQALQQQWLWRAMAETA
ncbi:DNA-binding domain-containing protein [Piscinibacter gummiphilus]|uniref:DNA-binding domain-containing protein n=1 Tax=Piscinibacter gummiphilus TaxID=946333 RepID=A0ABZ0CVX5_9BURK|nr:DNA-binding domain-containing protein [Piscinibacter gummiphilus]WOB07092.1 DNA-binding domain-containing protein [Piscinibacter gummiphilus]